jgi:hypothetical protein
MHLPEFALSCSRFSRFCGTQRTRVDIYKWEMAIDKSHAVEQVINDLFDRAISSVTSTATVIAVVDHGNRSISRPNHVVAFINGNSQL